MKLITFLGVGRYEPVEYVWNGQRCMTPYLSEALVQWLEPEEVVVLLTDAAKNAGHWPKLQAALDGKTQLTPADIPDGKSESELWKIFDRLTDHIAEGESFAFDITHGFRSLPILALLAGAYARTIRDARMEYLLYGAYEARNRENNLTPVFDLTPFVSLFDWIPAAEKFRDTGDARAMATMLKQAYNIGRHQTGGGAGVSLSKSIPNLVGTLGKLSSALQLTRPSEIAKHAQTLAERLDDAATDLENWARPFALILDRVKESFLPFADPGLATQAKLIRWYCDNGLILQAATLMREWLVSLACQRLGLEPVTEGQNISNALNDLVGIKHEVRDTSPSPHLSIMQHWEDAYTVKNLWSQVRDLRNDLAHCGLNKNPASAASLQKRTERAAQAIAELVP